MNFKYGVSLVLENFVLKEKPSRLNSLLEKMFHTSSETSLYSTKKVTFRWTISNFSFCADDTGDLMQSSAFPLGTSAEKWCLKIYPGGIDAASKNYISLCLMLVSSSSNGGVKATFEFHLLNTRGEKAKSFKSPKPAIFTEGIEWAYGKFIKRTNLLNKANELLLDDIITIYCELNVFYPCEVNKTLQSNQIEKPLVDPNLSKHMEELFEKQMLTDITFCIEGRDLKAHKAILASRSTVFGAMCEPNFQEGLSNKVEIVDIKYDVFKAMLHFIYTDKFVSRDMAMELFIAADKYDLERLKALTAKEISGNITTENSTEVLALADLHNCDIMKRQTLEFIVNHATGVMDTAGWKNLQKTHPHLVAEAYKELVKRQKK